MRTLDLNKRAAVCKSAMRLITQLGFDGVSIAKIARDAGVSPATIYIYFENKEDMINYLYIEAKKELSQFVLRNFEPGNDYEKIFKELFYQHWFYFYQHPESFAFIEQFSNSPLIAGISTEEGSSYYRPVLDLIQQAQSEGVLRPLPIPILLSLAVAPLIRLAKLHASQNIQPQELETVIDILWHSIKA